jgi:hypothetical protein
LYVENEVEELKFQVSMASRNLAIGRELIKIEKIIQKEGGHYEFIINDIFIGENGKQKIDPNTRMLSKRIAEIQDIDEYI